jgi:hypothetical protein
LARNWLLASVDDDLKKDIYERLSMFDGFNSHWLQMVHLIESTSYKRFTNIKEAVEKLTIHQFPGQSVKDLAGAFLNKAKELDNHGFYEHLLTLVMLDSFLQGGGSNADIHTAQYQHDLFQLRQELDTALVKIGQMDSNAQNKYMVPNGLTYREICSEAEEEWKKLFDDGKWAPAKTKPDPRRLPAGFGANLAETDKEPSAMQASVNALLQHLQLMSSHQQGSAGSKPRNCHSYNKPGHWARECPDKNNSRASQASGQGKTSWKNMAPAKNEGCIKVEGEGNYAKWKKERNGKLFYWCGKCNRWSTTHWTKEHTEQPSAHTANLTVLSTGDEDNDKEWPCAFVANLQDCDEPSSLLNGLP